MKSKLITLLTCAASLACAAASSPAAADQPIEAAFAITNQLQLKTTNNNANSELATKVRGMLTAHRGVSQLQLRITARNGSILLQGEAASRSQRQLISQYAIAVEGVHGVINEITITTNAPAPARQQEAAIDDAAVAAQIRLVLLYHCPSQMQDINFEVCAGVVHMSCKKMSPQQKDMLGMLIADINGVKYLINTDDGLTAYCSDAANLSQLEIAQLTQLPPATSLAMITP